MLLKNAQKKIKRKKEFLRGAYEYSHQILLQAVHGRGLIKNRVMCLRQGRGTKDSANFCVRIIQQKVTSHAVENQAELSSR